MCFPTSHHANHSGHRSVTLHEPKSTVGRPQELEPEKTLGTQIYPGKSMASWYSLEKNVKVKPLTALCFGCYLRYSLI